jgi:hypothetical protein
MGLYPIILLTKLFKIDRICPRNDWYTLQLLQLFSFLTWRNSFSFNFKSGCGFVVSSRNVTHDAKSRVYGWTFSSILTPADRFCHAWFKIFCTIYFCCPEIRTSSIDWAQQSGFHNCWRRQNLVTETTFQIQILTCILSRKIMITF